MLTEEETILVGDLGSMTKEELNRDESIL